jgi:hypothetical protein
MVISVLIAAYWSLTYISLLNMEVDSEKTNLLLL